MAFGFKNLEEYFEKNKKGKQPVGTSVNPLGAFAIKPMVQDFNRPVDYPTPLPQKPFNFDPDYQAGKLSEALQGPDAEGRNKASSIKGPNAEGRDKAFGIPGPPIEGREKASSLEGQAFTPKDRAFGVKGPDYTTATLGQNIVGDEHTTTEPLKPRSGAPEYSTQIPTPAEQGPEHTTQNPIPAEVGPGHTTQMPIKDIVAPSFTTKEPIPSGIHTHGGPFTGTSIRHKVDQLSPSKDGAMLELIVNKQWKDRREIFGSSKGDIITHMNNNQSGYMHVSGEPGNMEFKMENKQVPAGGSSIWTHTRLGGKTTIQANGIPNVTDPYYKKFTLVRQANSDASPQEINFNGNSTPAAAQIRRGNILSNEKLVDGLYKKVGKNKFVDIRDEAQRNNPRSPLFMKSPFIQRGMQKGGGAENPSSPGFLPSLDPVDGAIGMITAPLIDTLRIGKYLISPDGLLFMAKQFGLQLTNPRSEWKIGLHRGRIFNPIALALQVPANALGIHMDRHWLGPLNGEDSKYEKLISDNNANTPQNTLEGDGPSALSLQGTNRLVGMLDEMSTGILGIGKTPGSKIDMLSGLMGPKSLFGIGQTRFFKHTSGRDVFFDDEIGELVGELFEPETPYLKAAAFGEHSEAANQGADGDIKPYSTHNKAIKGGHPTYAREDYDEYFGGSEGTPGFIESNIKELNSMDDIGASNMSGMFNVMSYDDIAHFRRTPKKFRDFRNQNAEPSASAMFEVDNDYNTYEGRKAFILRWAGGMPDYGSTTPGMSHLTGEEDPSKGDFVKVILGKTGENVEPVQLRSYIEDISDKLSSTYSTVGYSGNPADSYIFDKISRAWSLKITVPAFTSKELKKNFQNLNMIMRHASPTIQAQVAGGNITYITVGDLWDELPTLLTDFDYTINQDGGWDINHGRLEGWSDGEGAAETVTHELPMLFSVSLGGKFLANDDGGIWNSQGRFFSEEIIDPVPAAE